MSNPLRDYERLSAAIDAISIHVERYEIYAADLRRVRAEQAALRERRPGMRPRLDDMEAELSYLRVRALAPSTVVQIGRDDGWSASWLLRALRDNGHGRLHSFDPSGRAGEDVPGELAEGRWSLEAGDVRERAEALPRRIDYLYLGGSRSGRFARWYLPRLVAALAPGTPVSVRDVFRHRSPLPLGEASVVLKWLRRRHLEYFTAAPARQPVVHRQLDRVRRELGLRDPVHVGDRNPMIFFQTA
ncbi:class I SAM-dependent methyltransferase [Glycomyces tarimensis]